MSKTPAVTDVIEYRLSESDIRTIAERRGAATFQSSSGLAMANDSLSIGNPASTGDVVPLVICRVWPDEYGPGVPGVNGQALLDGRDSHWVTSAREGTEPGQWNWPTGKAANLKPDLCPGSNLPGIGAPMGTLRCSLVACKHEEPIPANGHNVRTHSKPKPS